MKTSKVAEIESKRKQKEDADQTIKKLEAKVVNNKNAM
jgi:hypothetical protein